METIDTFGIWDIIINGILASGLIGTVIFFKSKKRKSNAEASGAELENSERIIRLQSDHITRMENRMTKIDLRIEKLELRIEQKQIIIQQAYTCEIPAHQCPVLQKRDQITNTTENDKGFKE